MINDPLVPIRTVADLLKLSPRHIARLAADEKMPKPANGQMPLVQSLVAYVEHLRASADPQLAAERLRLLTESADKLALENERTRGTLVVVEAVYTHFEGLFVALRARILASSLEDQEKDQLLNDLRKIKAKDIPTGDVDDPPQVKSPDMAPPAARKSSKAEQPGKL